VVRDGTVAALHRLVGNASNGEMNLVARAKTSKSNNQGGNSSFTSQDDTLGSTTAGAGAGATGTRDERVRRFRRLGGQPQRNARQARQGGDEQGNARRRPCRRGGRDQRQPSVRRKIRDAGLDAADSASSAASSMASSVGKLGSLIADAVADAAQKVLGGGG
jgi:hypothetical protein